MKTLYTYTITDPDTGDVVTGLESRSLATGDKIA